MKPKIQALRIAIVSAFALLILTSCSAELGVGRVRGPVAVRHGPPAHAPAHGYRRKHVGDVELVYDSGCGIYVVVGSPDHYYCNDRFYRLSGGEWQVSLTLDGGWVRISDDRLPPGLRKNRVAKANHGRGPKKLK